MLLYSPLLRYVEDSMPIEQYQFLKNNYSQDRYCLDGQFVISPMHFDVMPKDVRKVINWINKNIVLNLGHTCMDYKGTQTNGVLIRIATGMINNLDLPRDLKIEMHNNIVLNLQKELNRLELSLFPF